MKVVYNGRIEVENTKMRFSEYSIPESFANIFVIILPFKCKIYQISAILINNMQSINNDEKNGGVN